jgi:hypothetical protein
VFGVLQRKGVKAGKERMEQLPKQQGTFGMLNEGNLNENQNWSNSSSRVLPAAGERSFVPQEDKKKKGRRRAKERPRQGTSICPFSMLSANG